MKFILLLIVLASSLGIAESGKFLIGRDSVEFTPKIPDAYLKKGVKLRDESIRNSPFGNYLKYDSSQLKIFAWRSPMTRSDSINNADAGILSRRWGVKEGKRSRYLNISDLKKMGFKQVSVDDIILWIIGGRKVKSEEQFKKYYSELRRGGIVQRDLPANFILSERFDVKGYYYQSATVFEEPRFRKYHYLISPSNEVMLLKCETIIDIKFPKYIQSPAYPGVMILNDTADSAADKASGAFMEITEKYKAQLLE
jgi:hypothetical protein